MPPNPFNTMAFISLTGSAGASGAAVSADVATAASGLALFSAILLNAR